VESDGELVSELGPGDYFGEIALVTGARRTASITTRTPARLLVFNAPAFRALLSRAPRPPQGGLEGRSPARVVVLVRARNFRPPLRVREPRRSG
jgi:Cyclic nucleotide-binding domain